ncbi:hypothetical protein I5535_12695 [Rhodobacteraceae bacterium F11138]|nr:hypothetical protein [Rhodobacteraceae bacterium F11138]
MSAAVQTESFWAALILAPLGFTAIGAILGVSAYSYAILTAKLGLPPLPSGRWLIP